MDDTADGRVVVITGANEGIGYHLASTLLEKGYRVAGLDVNSDQLEPLEAMNPDRFRYLACDVTSDGDVEAAIESVIDEWGGIDILVNNAAIFEFAPFTERTMADTRREFEVNVFGYMRTIQAVLPHMLERDGGVIHNVSSGVGLVGSPGLSGYAASKGAIEAFVRSLRLELRYTDVAVTLVHLPLTDTQSAAELGYGDSMMTDPAVVGRKLAGKIERTDRVIHVDWKTKIGLSLSRRFPYIVKKGSERLAEA